MSQVRPSGRALPRWSLVMVDFVNTTMQTPASIAALPACSAIVWVEPPLSASPASFGSALMLGQVVSPHTKLLPPSPTDAPAVSKLKEQFPPGLLLKIVFFEMKAPAE
jgi:hypothetical protein